MKNVKKYLDSFCISCSDNFLELKSNGYYGLFGSWKYIVESEFHPFFCDVIPKKHLTFNCNNETLQFWFVDNFKIIGEYGYAQTYSHLPRLEADINGYYHRWTEEEIINYIQKYKNIISREKILNKLINE